MAELPVAESCNRIKKMSSIIKILPDEETLIRQSADEVTGLINQTLAEKDICTFVLSGGSTPKALYSKLASAPYRKTVRWEKVHLFWGDERCVPPDHQDSNYRMVKESLLDHIDLPPENIHRISGEKPPDVAAQEYEQEVRKYVSGACGIPRFDITLSGIGDDGHTASLFPGTPVLKEQKKLVASVYVPGLKSWRITLTFPVINNSKVILFLVKGSSKARIMSQVLNGNSSGNRYPVQKINPTDGKKIWFLDKKAAAMLE